MSAVEWMALKEWAVLADALGRGEILALVRKGGIREQRAGFSVRHERFLVYPTHFHEKQAELAERFHLRLAATGERRAPDGILRIELLAEVVAVWRVTELDRMRDVAAEHGLSWPAVASRFHYRNRPLVHVIAVRVSRLAQPAELRDERRYAGCVSWVKLDQPVDVREVTPVLANEELGRRVENVSAALGRPLAQLGDA